MLIRDRRRIQRFQELIKERRRHGDGRLVLPQDLVGAILGGGPDEIAQWDLSDFCSAFHPRLTLVREPKLQPRCRRHRDHLLSVQMYGRLCRLSTVLRRWSKSPTLTAGAARL